MFECPSLVTRKVILDCFGRPRFECNVIPAISEKGKVVNASHDTHFDRTGDKNRPNH